MRFFDLTKKSSKNRLIPYFFTASPGVQSLPTWQSSHVAFVRHSNLPLLTPEGVLACRCARHGDKLEDESSLLARRGEQLAEGKGVHREVESEGSWRQNAALMNKNRMRRTWWISRPTTTKSNTLTETTNVDSAEISGKVYRLTRGGLKASCDLQASI